MMDDTMFRIDLLDDMRWSPLWQRYYESAAPFDPVTPHTLHCLVPVPGRSGTLLFSNEGVFYSPLSAKKTLQQFAAAHCFPDPQILARSLKEAGCFGQYLFPFVCPYFTLFPLEGKDRTLWLNPLEIQTIKKFQDSYYAEMIHAPSLVLPIHRRRVIQHAENATLILATMSRGQFHFQKKGKSPFDYLTFPDTPFGNLLRMRSSLQQFRTPIGKLNRLYNQAYTLHHCSRFITDPTELKNVRWV